MKNTLRIVFIIVLFIGAALGFRYWALSNFDSTLSNLDDSLFTPVTRVEDKTLYNANPIISETSSNSTTSDLSLVKESDISFIFPTKGANVYEGCHYDINFDSDVELKMATMSLIDSGTRQSSGPVASGLPKDIKLENNSFDWLVGNVWPGGYYISVSSINNQELSKKSPVFNIKKIPSDVDKSKVDEFCKNN